MDWNNFCFACLTDDKRLIAYNMKTQEFRAIFRRNNLQLCYICEKVARRAEMFMINIQGNQIWLESLQNTTTIRTRIQPLINLAYQPLPSVTLGDADIESKDFEATIKSELKEENEDDDYADLMPIVKEDELSLKAGLKTEDIKEKRVKRRKTESKRLNRSKKLTEKVNVKSKDGYETFHITIEQCLLERQKRSQAKEYIDMDYKCDSCVKGFVFKGAYYKHMEKHSKSNGPHSCDICHQKFKSKLYLLSHLKYHTLRYRCIVCGYTKSNRPSVKDHYIAKHRGDVFPVLFNCQECAKTFKREISLRRHRLNFHAQKSRVQCDYCKKTYAAKDSLTTHMVSNHPAEVSGGQKMRRYVCEECGKEFTAPSLLHKHMDSHSDRKDYYCVECDKSFKSQSILTTHLRTTISHCKYIEMPLPCLECDKKFAIKRDLERHMNRVHLNIKPHQCDQCDRAYINADDLRKHQRHAHEGYKRPLRYPCSLCDKIFDSNRILKAHIRTHTGERPYECSDCSATFAQSGTLGTHYKLVHLQLTRDGKPKNHRIIKP